ncbi:hypothetical protein [Bradyrhizobium sp. CCGUVB14]|uniref:hypothetical protein n=1 Tax=Bradyrhizobium sp. CCGUVB14 TaxID=2949628 RepID=UPI0020B2A54F|nr:hypothetical protein [Bradyrhizobium sp. CCGUVB14]MCP3445816.1 hypothetical protein [Bradyrhizobium sp. CCGUVB14]
MISNGLTDMRTWAVCLIAYCVACTNAVACFGTVEYRGGILFEHVPIDIDAPIVIEATIYEVSGNELRARVDRVIKGSTDAKHVKIFVTELDCPQVGVGIGQGIVLGTLRNDPQHGIVLQAIQKANAFDWSKAFFAKQMKFMMLQSASKASSGLLSAAYMVLVQNRN